MKLWKHNISLFLLFAATATLVLIPLLASNNLIPPTMDYINHFSAIAQAAKAIFSGQFPIRFAPSSHEGWQYPLFQFYSPTSYSVAGVIYQWFTHENSFLAYKITIWFALILGGFYMYRLCNSLLSNKTAALLASLVYITAPYQIILIDYIGAFNESIALGILPAVLYYTLKNFKQPFYLKTFLPLSIAWYCLMTTHLISFICSSFFIFLALMLFTLYNRTWKNFFSILIAYLFSCLLGLWHLAPIIVFSKYLMMNSTFNLSTHLNAFSPSLMNLLSPLPTISRGIFYNGFAERISQIHPSLGIPIALAVGTSIMRWTIYLFMLRSLSSNKANPLQLRSEAYIPVLKMTSMSSSRCACNGFALFEDSLRNISYLLVLFILAFLITWSPFNFWKWLPNSFMSIQYSWRLLGQTTWIGAILFGYMISWLFQNKPTMITITICITLILFSASLWLIPQEKKISRVPMATSPLYSDILNKNAISSALPTNYNFLINANKNSQWINTVDSVLLYYSPYIKSLDLHSLKPITLPSAIIRFENPPFVTVHGNIPDQIHLHHQKVSVLVNNIATRNYSLLPGPFQWKIPLNQSLKKNDFINIKFKAPLDIKIPIEKIALGGLLNSSKVIDLQKTMPYCKQRNNESECELYVPGNIILAVLPLFYYPDMLNITINGKPALYLGVYYQNALITGVIPHSNQINKIKIQFRGLIWANDLSSAAWQLWLILFIYGIGKYLQLRRHAI